MKRNRIYQCRPMRGWNAMNLILPKLYHKDLKSSQREKTTDLKNGSNKWASQRYCGASLMEQGENDGHSRRTLRNKGTSKPTEIEEAYLGKTLRKGIYRESTSGIRKMLSEAYLRHEGLFCLKFLSSAERMLLDHQRSCH